MNATTQGYLSLTISFFCELSLNGEGLNLPFTRAWTGTQIYDPALLLEVCTDTSRSLVSNKVSKIPRRLRLEVVSLIRYQERKMKFVIVLDSLCEHNRLVQKVDGKG